MNLGYDQNLVFMSGNLHREVRPPTSFDMSIRGTDEQVLTQGGFFVPVKSLDELDAQWSFSWDHLSAAEVEILRELYDEPDLSVNTPLGLPVSGYLDAFESQGVPGVVDAETGEALYSATAEFRIVTIGFTSYVKPLPASGSLPFGSELGAPVDARPVAVVEPAGGPPLGFNDGWASVEGGGVNAWHDLAPPSNPDAPWPRYPRANHPSAHGIDPRWISLDTRLLPPVRGSVFMAFKPREETTP